MRQFGVVLFAAFFAGAVDAVEITPQDGCHRLTVEIRSCKKSSPTGLCAVVKPGALSARRYLIQDSPWTGLLKSLNVPFNQLVLVGRTAGARFVPSRRPRLHASSPDEILNDTGTVEPLEEKECR